MDLKSFHFPPLTAAEMVFPTIETNKELLAESKDRGFYNGNTPYNKLFSDIFFGGGKITFKKNVDAKFASMAWPYCRAFMRSWSPKHEEKEAICAMLMSELLEPKLAKV